MFLRSAKDFLKPFGTVIIVHKCSHPFTRWNIEGHARKLGYYLETSVQYAAGEFLREHQGYTNVYGSGRKIDKPFPIGTCARYAFRLSQQYA